MKLAFCLFRYSPYSGLSRDFLRVALECRARGHEICVFAAQWEGEQPEGIEFCLLPARRWMNHSQNMSFYRRLKAEVRTRNFDAVIGFNKMPGLDLYYGADYCYIGRVRPQYPWLYRFTPRYSNMVAFERAVFDIHSRTRILSISEREKQIYQQFYATPDKRFHVLPPTLDSKRIVQCDRDAVRERMRDALQVGDNDCAVMFIGSGFKTKGLDRAIESVAALSSDLRKRTRLFVVGQDNESPFRKLVDARGLGERVTFLGGRDDIPELMMGGDLLIHPAYSENTGTVLLEAITAGLPVLTTDVCGYASHITQAKAGRVLRSPFAQQDLNESLEAMLTSPQADAWSKNGLAYGANPELYRMPETAADLIEQWGDDRAREKRAAAIETEPGIRVYLRDDFRHAIAEDNAGRVGFQEVMDTSGEVYREAPGRRTIRVAAESKGDTSYFIKTHTGVGWQEIVKNIAYFRMPVLGATNEWHGIHRMRRLGIDTLRIAGYGTDGGNPARRHSFIATDEITDATSLEDYCRPWSEAPPTGGDALREKRWIINEVARIGRAMHTSGANHRDFYLCHFLLKSDPEQPQIPGRLHVIDLHRMQLRKKTPTRWIVKDISGLYYSSMQIGLTQRDLLRFMRAYSAKPLRTILATEGAFWSRVNFKSHNLYESEARRAKRGEQSNPARTFKSTTRSNAESSTDAS